MVTKWKLTKKEEEVLSLMARGYSLRGIADKLGIAFSTAKTHLVSIYEELGLTHCNENIHQYTTAALMYLYRK